MDTGQFVQYSRADRGLRQDNIRQLSHDVVIAPVARKEEFNVGEIGTAEQQLPEMSHAERVVEGEVKLSQGAASQTGKLQNSVGTRQRSGLELQAAQAGKALGQAQHDSVSDSGKRFPVKGLQAREPGQEVLYAARYKAHTAGQVESGQRREDLVKEVVAPQ
jgi:hypothetical protein